MSAKMVMAIGAAVTADGFVLATRGGLNLPQCIMVGGWAGTAWFLLATALQLGFKR